MIWRRRVLEPLPWHLVIAPLIPLLVLLADNVAFISPHIVLWPFVVSAIFSTVLWVLLMPIARNAHAAALATTWLVFGGMSARAVERTASSAGLGFMAPVLYVAGIAAAGFILRSSRPTAVWTVHANRVLALTLVFLALPFAWGELRRTRTRVEPFHLAQPVAVSLRPDVYVLVLDGYAREDVLRDVYEFSNPLVPELQAMGFYVADDAAANYAQTALSLASAFNGDYLPALGHPYTPSMSTRRGLGDLIRDSRFFRAFAESGYSTTAYSSEYALIRPGPADQTPGPFGYLDDFGYAAYESTAMPMLLQAAGLPRNTLPLALHRRHLDWTLGHLSTAAPEDESRPVLIFAHLLAPHPPFAFDAEGAGRATRVPALLHEGDHWLRIARGTGESYKSGYLDTLRFLNAGVRKAIRDIVDRRRRPTIILIHSDHGPGSGLVWDNPAETDVRERMGILLAVYFSNGDASGFGIRTTLVNAYRVILNRALGTTLPRLEDRSYHSSMSQPFSYVDVTDRLSSDGCSRRAGPSPFPAQQGT